MVITPEEIKNVRRDAELLFSQQQVESALDRMAFAIIDDLAETNPLLLCVMNGGMVPLGQLLTRLQFPLRTDYLHATRYRGSTVGGDELIWKKELDIPMTGETVLIVDDILDEGYTLAAVEAYCYNEGARQVKSAVLVRKEHNRGVEYESDYIGLTVPDKYVFGYGMDYKGYWRNAPGIYAVD